MSAFVPRQGRVHVHLRFACTCMFISIQLVAEPEFVQGARYDISYATTSTYTSITNPGLAFSYNRSCASPSFSAPTFLRSRLPSGLFGRGSGAQQVVTCNAVVSHAHDSAKQQQTKPSNNNYNNYNNYNTTTT